MTPSVATLTKKIRESEDAVAKRAAVIEMGYMTQASAYPVLVEQLDDPNISVRHAAVISLGRHGNPDAIEEIKKPKILHSRAVNVRWAAVTALGKLGDYRVIDQLLKAIDDDEWIVRNQAVTELKIKIRDIIEKRDVRLARTRVNAGNQQAAPTTLFKQPHPFLDAQLATRQHNDTIGLGGGFLRCAHHIDGKQNKAKHESQKCGAEDAYQPFR